MNIISIFAGAGGLDRGFENAGFNVVWANEYDKKIWDTYKRNHPNTYLETKSITEVKVDEIPDNIIGLIGGPPCQSWSLAGSMRGIEDERGKLFFDYLRILKAKKPLFFVAENVPGMLSSKHIDQFNNIKNMFIDCGYRVNHSLLNASDYGVAQDRKRVIMVGYRKDLQIEFNFDNLKKELPKKTLADILADLPEPLPALEKNKTNGHTDKIANNEYFTGDFSSMFMSRNRIRKWNEQSFTIQAGARHAPIHPSFDPMGNIDKDKWEFSGPKYRRLSVRECARIQSFPDDFIFVYESLADAYKMIGNAVPVKLSEVIATEIMSDLNMLKHCEVAIDKE